MKSSTDSTPAPSTTFFSLADQTKPGHCKILALFLIDPHLKGFEYAKCILSAEGLVVRLYCSTWYTFGSASCRKLWDAEFDGVKDDFSLSPDETKEIRWMRKNSLR